MPIPYPRPDISARDDNGSESIGFKDTSGIFRAVSATDPLPTQAGTVTPQSIANQFMIKNEDITDPLYDYYGYAPPGSLPTDVVWAGVRVNKNPSAHGGEVTRVAYPIAWTGVTTATYS